MPTASRCADLLRNYPRDYFISQFSAGAAATLALFLDSVPPTLIIASYAGRRASDSYGNNSVHTVREERRHRANVITLKYAPRMRNPFAIGRTCASAASLREKTVFACDRSAVPATVRSRFDRHRRGTRTKGSASVRGETTLSKLANLFVYSLSSRLIDSLLTNRENLFLSTKPPSTSSPLFLLLLPLQSRCRK